MDRQSEAAARAALVAAEENLTTLTRCERGGRVLLCARRRAPLPAELRGRLAVLPGTARVFAGEPLGYVKRGRQLFDSAAGMAALAEAENLTPGRAASCYEAALLGLSEKEVAAEMARRLDIMLAAVSRGLGRGCPSMQLLRPTAADI